MKCSPHPGIFMNPRGPDFAEGYILKLSSLSLYLVKRKHPWARKRSLMTIALTLLQKLGVVNTEMVDCFQRVIFRMTKGFGQERCQVQIMLTAAHYSRPLFVQWGSETFSKALMKMLGTINL